MCTRYITPEQAEIEREWAISRQSPNRWWEGHVRERAIGPLRAAPYLKAHGELEIGQWGMIPPDSPKSTPTSKKTGKRLSTFNARMETVATAWTFRFPWARGQRCLIPASSYDEPYWGEKDAQGEPRNIWWRFARADGRPWALAGLWAEWVDPATGEIVPNFTMLTTNCDGHPLLSLMHKPEVDKDGKLLPPDKQDKRSVISVEQGDWDAWLHGTKEQALALVKVAPLAAFAHGAADPGQAVALALTAT